MKKFVFVLMPFNDKFDNVYKLGIKAAANELGAYCERVDEQQFEGRITDRIYNQINKADVIVADMSGQNPNVFYEVGYAHALEKKVVLITNDYNDIPFDLKDYPHIIYNSNNISDLILSLKNRIDFYLNNPNSIQISQHTTKLFCQSKSILNGSLFNLGVINRRESYWKNGVDFTIDILNDSGSILQNPYQIGFEMIGLGISEKFPRDGNPKLESTIHALSENKRLYLFTIERDILPGSRDQIPLHISKYSDYSHNSSENGDFETPLIIHLFTKLGTFKTELTLSYSID